MNTFREIAPAAQYVEFDGAQIAYIKRPARSPVSKTPLVFLHGGALDHRMWAPQLRAFDDRQLIALDARGHGWTTSPNGASFRYCDDVVAVLDALDLERAVLVGVSMGASTAVDTALEYPSRVEGAVACGAGTSEAEFRDPWVLEIFSEWQQAAQALNPEAWIGATLKFVAGPHRTLDEVDDHLLQQIEEMIRHTLFTHIMGQDGPVLPTPAVPVTETWPRLSSLEVPLLGITGSLDAADHLRMVRELTASAPKSHLVSIENTAHYPNLEQPASFNQAITSFLRDDLIL